MSYSLKVRGATAALALLALAAAFDEQVLKHQPIHAKDKEPALANAKAATDLLEVDEDKDVVIDVHGSLSWRNDDDGEQHITGVNIAASAHYVTREPAA
jgi:hypothetical protein